MKGGSCPFRHDSHPPVAQTIPDASRLAIGAGVSAQAPNQTQAPAPAYTGGKSTTTCHFYAVGNCKKGSDCPFNHPSKSQAEVEDGEANGAQAAAFSKQSPGDTRSLVPCKYQLRGGCRNGDACPYAHTDTVDSANVYNSKVCYYDAVKVVCHI